MFREHACQNSFPGLGKLPREWAPRGFQGDLWGVDKGEDMSCGAFWVPRSVLSEVSSHMIRSEGAREEQKPLKGQLGRSTVDYPRRNARFGFLRPSFPARVTAHVMTALLWSPALP